MYGECFPLFIEPVWENASKEFEEALEQVKTFTAGANNQMVLIGGIHLKRPEQFAVNSDGASVCGSKMRQNKNNKQGLRILKARAAGTSILSLCVWLGANGYCCHSEPFFENNNNGVEMWTYACQDAQAHITKQREAGTLEEWHFSPWNLSIAMNRKTPRFNELQPPDGSCVAECRYFVLELVLFSLQNFLDEMHVQVGNKGVFGFKTTS